MERNIKIAYIGGGSKQWARVFMNDLALAQGLGGEIALYDIDREAAERNRLIGERINLSEKTNSRFTYTNCETLYQALDGADFVVISILPATFQEMDSDVHAPERYGIYQSVGDTAGPGGVLRAMRTLPLFYGFADAVRRYCPKAWVINFTNPMSACLKALFDEFPEIRAFGCCHEVFHAQDFLCCVAAVELKVELPPRKEIYTDVCGINHFTWITKASWRGNDLLALLPSFMDKYFEEGYASERGKGRFAFRDGNYFIGSNQVKMDLFRRFGALGAAGDRHLVEFLNGGEYLASPDTASKWGFMLTPVSYRIDNQQKLIAETIALAGGELPVEVKKSDEEAVDLLRAILGFETVVSNVNLPNRGQVPFLPDGSIVETNCVFSSDSVSPVVAAEPPQAVRSLIHRASDNIDTLARAIRDRDIQTVFSAFIAQPLCSRLEHSDAKELFRQMVHSTQAYLTPWFGEKGLDF